MNFRPEEVHARSSVGSIVCRPTNRAVSITDDRLRLCREQFLILHLYHYGLSAIQAGCINSNCFTGYKPAHGQRFKPSLGEPFLLIIYGDAILGGLIIERRK